MSNRTHVLRLVLVVPLLAAGIALGAAKPASAAVTCGTTVGLPELLTGTVKGSVVVPSGMRCRIDGAVVRGGVTVEGGSLDILPGSEIRGAVSVSAPRSFVLNGAVVRGSVTVAGTPSGTALGIVDSEVRGDLVVTGHFANSGSIILTGNSVRGSMVVRDNTSTQVAGIGGSIDVGGNVVDVDLDCSGNTPAPTLRNNPANVVGGTKLGQCELL